MQSEAQWNSTPRKLFPVSNETKMDILPINNALNMTLGSVRQQILSMSWPFVISSVSAFFIARRRSFQLGGIEY